ncbi:ATP-binding cassette domain-containing protein [Vibrio sp. 10N.222.54.F6]|uniref:ATP-binding cassette domain-containing protein n=1 Tax=unclassified Vibrio TaxID=2614977 RepID=UPI000C829BC8|nr:ATP-binding cassette domain-containing protein [Vibrio sp. 10N.261.51.A7]PML71344.1 elongation factor 3 [Vibrio sp. 10N.261.51.A7]
MPTILANNLSFQLDTGEWLFKDITFNLSTRLTGLVGRNGAGKSLLLSLLIGQKQPTTGSISRQGSIGFYSQLPSTLLDSATTIADFLGLTEKLDALKAIEQGSCEIQHFNIVGDDWDLQESTQQLLATLKITSELTTPCNTLSGGQLALLQLHRLFTSNHDILILDEPSNHLDSDGRNWLLEQCQLFEGKILIVSHDRGLLRNMEGIYHLNSLGLRFYKGNYDGYFKQMSSQSEALDKQIAHHQSEKKRLERQAQVNKEKAQQRESQGNRLRKSGSQPKILMDAMKDKAGRTQAASATSQNNLKEQNQDKLQSLKEQKEQLKPQALYLQQSNSKKKNALLTVEDCRLEYGSGNPIHFSLSQGEQCYLSGANGCGKSILLKAIHNEHSNYTGTIKRLGSTVYLDQHFGLLDTQNTMFDSLMTHSDGLTESDARTLLAGIGFRRNSVYRKVAHLSGGEKMKLAMLIVSHKQDSPLLLLDEPDNHLDIDSKQILASALRDYQGAFILVSHDADFVEEVGVNQNHIQL